MPIRPDSAKVTDGYGFAKATQPSAVGRPVAWRAGRHAGNYSLTGRRGLPPAGVGITVPVSGCAGSSHRSWVVEFTADTNTIRPSGNHPGSATFAGLGDNRWIAPVATVSVKSATSPSRASCRR